jgi:hypothetical protein
MLFIYILSDPRTNAVRYVGKAKNVKRRLSRHLSPGNLAKSHHTANWLRSLVEAGMKPVVRTAEELPDDGDWEARERFWIAHYRSLGCDLTNLTDGGEGGASYGRRGKTNTPEHRAKCSAARKGVSIRQSDPEGNRRAAVIASWQRRQEEAAANGTVVKVKPRSMESRQRFSEKLKANPPDMSKAWMASAAARRGKPARNRGVPMSDEAKKKLRAAKAGKPWSAARWAAHWAKKNTNPECSHVE